MSVATPPVGLEVDSPEKRREPLLAIEALEVRYGPVHALRGATVYVDAGQIVCVLGANGAGKSSLMNAVGGLVPPAAGKVTFGGEDITGVPAEDAVRKGIALVPEGRRVYARLSVDENLRLGAAIRRNAAAVREDRERVAELFPVLSERANQAAGTLSGGQQQMLALGRALMARPRLLLLDEPSLGLAPKIVDQIFELMSRLRSEGITILLVEQNVTRALDIADHGYLLTLGRVVTSGKASQLLDNAAVETMYFARGE